jgi:hypothetical protein
MSGRRSSLNGGAGSSAAMGGVRSGRAGQLEKAIDALGERLLQTAVERYFEAGVVRSLPPQFLTETYSGKDAVPRALHCDWCNARLTVFSLCRFCLYGWRAQRSFTMC